MRTNDFSFERFVSYGCLVGDSAPSIGSAPPTVSSVSIPLDGFEQWLWTQTLNVKQTRRQLRVSWKSTPDMRFETEFGRVTITQFPKLTRNDYRPTYEVALRERAELSIRPKKPIPAQEIGSLFTRLQDLMILLTGSSHALAWPEVKLLRNRQSQTYYFPRHMSVVDPPKFYEIPANFPLLKPQFAEILSNWKKKLEAFGPGFHSYIATRRDMTLLVESRFSMLAQGLEAFHRTKFGDPPAPAAAQAIIDRILAQIADADDKTWLSQRLGTAPTLNQRISEILRDLPFGFSSARVKKFSYKVSSLRNDLAHYGGDRDKPPSVEYTRKLHNYCEAISPIYHALLLREIGVPDEAIKHWFSKGVLSGAIQYWLTEVGLVPKKTAKPAPPNSFTI
jgi:hypothetical protein